MAVYTSDQVAMILNTQGVAIAGIGGAPTFPRATEVRGIIKVIRFTIEQATPNPMPGSPPADPLANGDVVIIALLPPTCRIYMGEVFYNDWGGDVAIAVGKVDPNNPANTDPQHYLIANSVVSAGNAFFTENMTEQVGDDPQGDQSIGNEIPMFGAMPIQIIVTFAAGSFGSDGTLTGFIFFTEEGN